MPNNLTLLYVEDDKEIRENFAEIFSTYFDNIILADNGRDALKLYGKNHIDVIILDISIPGINGLNVASEIRESDNKVEIIILTGFSEKEKLIQAINTQIFAYLMKPVKQDELNKTLNEVIQKVYLDNMYDLSCNYSFDPNEELLFYKSQQIKISKNEKKLIKFLCENKNNHYTACDISNVLFNSPQEKQDPCNNVVQLISRFKKKMLSLYNQEYFFIDNIYGLGYKIAN